jgi:hypothetical protein
MELKVVKYFSPETLVNLVKIFGDQVEVIHSDKVYTISLESSSESHKVRLVVKGSEPLTEDDLSYRTYTHDLCGMIRIGIVKVSIGGIPVVLANEPDPEPDDVEDWDDRWDEFDPHSDEDNF